MTGAADEAEPAARITAARTLRRRRRQVVLVMVFAVIVLVGAVAVVVYQTWVAAPDLAVGSRHHVTVEVDHPCGPNSVVLRLVRYGGHVWWVDGSPSTAPGSGAAGTLIITRPVTSGVATGSTDTADLDVGGHLLALEGGGESGPVFSCPIQ
jgi:hypothetical protein